MKRFSAYQPNELAMKHYCTLPVNVEFFPSRLIQMSLCSRFDHTYYFHSVLTKRFCEDHQIIQCSFFASEVTVFEQKKNGERN